jgi:hypothetical protein
MRRLAAVALLMVGMAIPLFGQRGGGHGGGGGGHAAGASHGGFSSSGGAGFGGGFRGSAPARSGMGSRPAMGSSMVPRNGGGARFAGNGYGGVRSGMPMRGYGGAGGRLSGTRPEYSRSGYSRQGYGHGNGQGHSGDDRSGRRSHRPPYRSGYVGSGYGYGVGPWFGGEFIDPGYGLGYLGYGDAGYSDDVDNSGTYSNYVDSPNYGGDPGYGDDPNDANGVYGSQPDEQSGVRELPPYRGAYIPPSNEPRGAPLKMDAVTLVFKDGRPREQIHNYVLNRTTLTIWDTHERDIPVDQLDLAATEKVNRDAGVDFRLPDTSR